MGAHGNTGNSNALRYSPKQDAVITAGYKARTPVAAIAKELGKTRNQIIGRAWRLGLSKVGRLRKRELGRAVSAGRSYALLHRQISP